MYWFSGTRQPDGPEILDSILAIENELGLPAGALARHIAPLDARSWTGDNSFPWNDDALDAAMAEAFEVFDFKPDLREQSVHAVTDVGREGSVIRRRTRMLLQATQRPRSAYPVLEVMPWVPVPAPTFTVLGGGRISRTFSHPGGRVHGALIDFGRELAPTETTMLEYSLEYAKGSPPVHETGHGVAFRSHELLLWTRFHPLALPDWCNVVEETEGGSTVVAPAMPERHGSAHAVRRKFGPGALGMHWGYAGVDTLSPHQATTASTD